MDASVAVSHIRFHENPLSERDPMTQDEDMNGKR
jgi:hypothetical protein